MNKEISTKPNVLIEESEWKKNIIRIFKGTAFSIVLSILMLFIYALLLTYTTLSETTIMPVVLTITGISILVGSMVSTRKIRKNGLINGGLVGLIYIIILYLSSSLCLSGFSLSGNSFIMLAVGALTGIIGGIIGVNLNKKGY